MQGRIPVKKEPAYTIPRITLASYKFADGDTYPAGGMEMVDVRTIGKVSHTQPHRYPYHSPLTPTTQTATIQTKCGTGFIFIHLADFTQKPPNGAIYPDEKIIVHDTQLKLSTTPHVDRSNAGFSRAISVGDKSPQGIWVADDKTMSYDTLTDTHYQGSRIATTLEIPPPSHWKRHMKKKCGTEIIFLQIFLMRGLHAALRVVFARIFVRRHVRCPSTP